MSRKGRSMTFLTRSGEDAYKAQGEPKRISLVGFAGNSCCERKFLTCCRVQVVWCCMVFDLDIV